MVYKVTMYHYTGAQAKRPSSITGQEAVICEVEQACSQLNKLRDLQLDEPFLRAVAAEIRALIYLIPYFVPYLLGASSFGHLTQSSVLAIAPHVHLLQKHERGLMLSIFNLNYVYLVSGG